MMASDDYVHDECDEKNNDAHDEYNYDDAVLQGCTNFTDDIAVAVHDNKAMKGAAVAGSFSDVALEERI